MGTNYYLQLPGKDPCPHCGRSDNPERLHIGKSSGGWCFSLHVHPAIGINDLDDWKKFFPKGQIFDEYGEKIDESVMVETIASRRRDQSLDSGTWVGSGYLSEADFHDKNYSERGPNNLLRHKLGHHCIKHGQGTWDCIIGEFS